MNIKRKIDTCKKKISNMESVNSEIDRQYNEFKNFMAPQESELENLRLDLSKYVDNNIISIRFGDLLSELSKISNIDKKDISYNIKTNLVSYKDTDTIKEMIKKECGQVHALVYIEDKKNKSFIYYFDFQVDVVDEEVLKKLQIVPVKLRNRLVGNQYEVHVNDSENFYVNISLLNLMEENNFFSPSDLIIDAVQNCVNKENKESKVKKIGGKK